MYTRNVAKLEAERLVNGLQAMGRAKLGFLDLLDDKGYVPAEPKVETRLVKAATATVMAVISTCHTLREGWFMMVEPEFDFLDLLAAKGQVPDGAVLAVPAHKGANDNWPATEVAA